MKLSHIAALSLATLSLVACVGEEEPVDGADVQNVTEKQGGQIELYRSQADGAFRFRMKAKNGQIILTGEGYESKDGILNAIESIRENGSEEDGYELQPASSNPDGRYDGDWYFNLVAANGEVLGTSEIYTSKGSAKTGMETVVGYVRGGLKLDDWTDQCGFEIFEGADGQIWFRLRAANGEKLLRGEGYETEAGAKEGIDDLVTWGYYDEYYELGQSQDEQWYFNVVAPNHEVLGTSETYEASDSAEHAMGLVRDIVGEYQWCFTDQL